MQIVIYNRAFSSKGIIFFYLTIVCIVLVINILVYLNWDLGASLLQFYNLGNNIYQDTFKFSTILLISLTRLEKRRRRTNLTNLTYNKDIKQNVLKKGLTKSIKPITPEEFKYLTYANLFSLIKEKDKGLPTNNPFILAKRYLKKKTPPSVKIINELLNHRNVKINQKEFDELSNLPFSQFDLPLSINDKERLTSIIGSSDSLVKTHYCAYMFTYLKTGEKYIGSTINSGQRIRVYLKPGSPMKAIKGSFGRHLAKNKLNDLRLSVAVIPAHLSRDNFNLVLEQILFLKHYPEFNDVYVAGSGGETVFSAEDLIKKMKVRGTPIYVYNLDKSKLIHAFYSYRQAGRLLPCRWNSIRDAVLGHRTFRGLYFDTQLIDSAFIEYVSIENLIKTMEEHIETYGVIHKGKTPSIILASHNETKECWQFKSIPELNKFFKALSLKTISVDKFKRHVSQKDPLYGFTLTKYPINEISDLSLKKSLNFDVNHYLTTKLSKIYPIVLNPQS